MIFEWRSIQFFKGDFNMLRIVRISEKDSNRIIAESSVILEFDDASDQDYFDKAGQDAINDGIVNPQIRSDYKIEYAD